MLTTGLRIVQGALVAASLYLIYAAAAPLVGAALPQDGLRPLPQIAEPVERSLEDYAIVMSRDLFKTAKQALPPAPAPPPPPPTEDLEETQLKLKLLGTVWGNEARLSVAIIQDMSARETEVVRVGERISGAELVSISKGQVVLDNAGSRESLSMEDEVDRPLTLDQRKAAAAKNRAEARERMRRGVRPNLSKTRRNFVKDPLSEFKRIPQRLTRAAWLRAYPDLELGPEEQVVAINGVAIDFFKGPDGRAKKLLTKPGPKRLQLRQADGTQRNVVYGGS